MIRRTDPMIFAIFAPKIGKTEGYSPSYDNSTRCAYHQNCRRVIL